MAYKKKSTKEWSKISGVNGHQAIKKTLTWLPIFLIVMGFAGLTICSFIIYSNITRPKIPKDVHITTSPSIDKPTHDMLVKYKVAPDLPKYISVTKLNIYKARVFSLDVKDGQITNPGNINDAGWYNGSAKPGQRGAMFIFGHLSSWQAKGLFYDLRKLKIGDTVSITRGDDRIFNYKVVSSKTYPANQVDMNTVLSPVLVSKPGLNLMTCAGKIIQGTNDFDERLVVFMTSSD
ncbi:MAG: class F sortase [Candidatus Saccharibacteria bacterium]